MDDIASNIPDCTIFLLAKAYQQSHGKFKKKLTPYGLTNVQHLILEGIWYKDGVTATELGKFLKLDKATLSGTLDRMEEGGWIKKQSDENDKRVYRLYPTAKTDKVKDALIEERVKANEELLADFTLEEKILFKRFLRSLF